MAAYKAQGKYTDDDPPKARNDAYTGLLSISFFAMFIGCVLLVIDYLSYDGMTPPRVKDNITQVKPGGAPLKAQPKPEPKVEPPDAKMEKDKADPKEKMEKDKVDAKDKDKGNGKDKAKEEKKE